MNRPLFSLIALLFIGGCVTNAQSINPNQTVFKPSPIYKAMTVEGTQIYYRDLSKVLPSAYRSAVRTAPLHHPETISAIEPTSKTSAGSTITMTRFPMRPLTTRAPKVTRIYLKKKKDQSAVVDAGRRS